MRRLSSSWVLLLACAVTAGAQTAPELIRNVRVFDGNRVQEHRSVLVKNGIIAQIGKRNLNYPGAVVISGEGRTLLPGLIDAHVHMPLDVEAALRQGVIFGVTTQLDMYTSPEKLVKIKAFERSDLPGLSDVRTAGMGVTVPGGHPTFLSGASVLPTLTRPEQAQSFVDARIAEGSDYIKVILDNGAEFKHPIPTLDDATLRAVVQAAHLRGKLVIAHVLMASYAKEAIEAGVDGLAHMYEGPPMDENFGALAAKHHIFVVPTLTVIYLDCGESPGIATAKDPLLAPYIRKEWLGALNVPLDPKLNGVCDSTRSGINQLIAAHVPVLAGTDAPVQGVTYGASEHEELQLLVATGLSPVEALSTATSAPAKAFRLNDRGRIALGLRADLLLVDGDPTINILGNPQHH